MLLIRHLEPSLLFLLVLDMSSLYHAAALLSEAMRFTTTLGAVALCYNFFLYSVQYLDFAFSHHVYFQQQGNLKKNKASCVMKIHQGYKIFCSLFQEESQKSHVKERNTDFLH